MHTIVTDVIKPIYIDKNSCLLSTWTVELIGINFTTDFIISIFDLIIKKILFIKIKTQV